MYVPQVKASGSTTQRAKSCLLKTDMFNSLAPLLAHFESCQKPKLLLWTSAPNGKGLLLVSIFNLPKGGSCKKGSRARP